MAEARLVIFDPFVLRAAVFQESTSVQHQALETLIKNCPNRLILDDEQGALNVAYSMELGGQFPLVRAQLTEILGPSVDKIVRGGRPRGIGSFRLPTRSHVNFVRPALALRPAYLVTQIPRLLATAQDAEKAFAIRVVSAHQYIQQEGIAP